MCCTALQYTCAVHQYTQPCTPACPPTPQPPSSFAPPARAAKEEGHHLHELPHARPPRRPERLAAVRRGLHNGPRRRREGQARPDVPERRRRRVQRRQHPRTRPRRQRRRPELPRSRAARPGSRAQPCSAAAAPATPTNATPSHARHVRRVQARPQLGPGRAWWCRHATAGCGRAGGVGGAAGPREARPGQALAGRWAADADGAQWKRWA
jgi:hypothetical protein